MFIDGNRIKIIFALKVFLDLPLNLLIVVAKRDAKQSKGGNVVYYMIPHG